MCKVREEGHCPDDEAALARIVVFEDAASEDQECKQLFSLVLETVFDEWVKEKKEDGGSNWGGKPEEVSEADDKEKRDNEERPREAWNVDPRSLIGQHLIVIQLL